MRTGIEQMASHPDARKILAHHEAGHAVANLILGFRIGEVTIAGAGRTVRIDDLRHLTDSPLVKAKRVLLSALAGPLADSMLLLGRGRTKQQIDRGLMRWDKAKHPSEPAGNDWDKVFQAADYIVPRVVQPRLEILNRSISQLHQLLDTPYIWAGIESVAAELQARETIDGKRVGELCSEALPPASGKRPRLNLKLTGDVELSIQWIIGDA